MADADLLSNVDVLSPFAGVAPAAIGNITTPGRGAILRLRLRLANVGD